MSDSRRRRKDYDDYDRANPRAKDRDRDRDHARKSRPSLSKPSSPRQSRRHYHSESSSRSPSPVTPSRPLPPQRSSSARLHRSDTMMSAPKVNRRVSSGGNYTGLDSRRESIPYPSFSKAHIREAVGVKNDLQRPGASGFTPENTNIGSPTTASPARMPYGVPPPSPPLTTIGNGIRRASSGSSFRHLSAENVKLDPVEEVAGTAKRGPRFSASRTSLREAEEGEGGLQPAFGISRPASRIQTGTSIGSGDAKRGSPLRPRSSRPDIRANDSAVDSELTSVSPGNKRPAGARTIGSYGSSRPSENGSSPHTSAGSHATRPVQATTSALDVNYLLDKGGLTHMLPPAFAVASRSPASSQTSLTDKRSLFAPYHTVLDDLETVLSRNGSLAVSTGYRSLGQRLLERLESTSGRSLVSSICSTLR